MTSRPAQPESPSCIEIRGAQVHNLKNVSVDIPLSGITAVAGVSGSGKSSLALGVIYAEGSRRYLESLSAYTRRRMTMAAGPKVDAVRHIPAALALRQRPAPAGVRSTFGTSTELLNSLRLMFSRLGTHLCPRGHPVPPSTKAIMTETIHCPECGSDFSLPAAEELSFNSTGACPRCGGTGTIRTVDLATLVPDESLSIDEGAVAPWNSLMWSLMTDVCRAMGVRTDIPFKDLSAREKDIVFNGPAVKKRIFYKAKNTNTAGELEFTYFNAVYTVQNALAKVKDDKGMKRVERFLREEVCPDCGGTRLSQKVRSSRLAGLGLDEVCALSLERCADFVRSVPDAVPAELKPVAAEICAAFDRTAARLFDLGLGYLSPDRAAATLSTGERQRVYLARAVRNRTCGVLYVLDEPSIGLHPHNLRGLEAVMRDLTSDGNPVLLVDHEPWLLHRADWIVEMGPGAGRSGGTVIATGTPEAVAASPASVIGPYLKGAVRAMNPSALARDEIFAKGRIRLVTGPVHTVRELEAEFPAGRLCVVTGVSGSGKTTLILEGLTAALEALFSHRPLPAHVRQADPGPISAVRLIDATPIGVNVRSTLATYSGIHDDLRRLFAATAAAREQKLKAGAFSYNTGSLRCPQCDGTGTISLDVQFLPDVEIPCPQCHGRRYSQQADTVRLEGSDGSCLSMPQILDLDVSAACDFCARMPQVARRLQTLKDLGLGYLQLGEQTPGLSGGEAQRLKLATEMGRPQQGTLFVFDEPTIGLHPQDVAALIRILKQLTAAGATVVVIEHDLDVIGSADWIIDMGPDGGENGGRIVVSGTMAEVASCRQSRTGKYLAQYLKGTETPGT